MAVGGREASVMQYYHILRQFLYRKPRSHLLNPRAQNTASPHTLAIDSGCAARVVGPELVTRVDSHRPRRPPRCVHSDGWCRGGSKWTTLRAARQSRHTHSLDFDREVVCRATHLSRRWCISWCTAERVCFCFYRVERRITASDVLPCKRHQHVQYCNWHSHYSSEAQYY